MAIVTRLNLTDIRVLQSATITEFSATNVAGTLSTGQSFRIIGTGFAAPDATGLPTSGTVTGLQINNPPFGFDSNSLVISDLSMSMAALRTYAAGNLVDGFLFDALSGNDTLSGYHDFKDSLTGYGGDDRISLEWYSSFDTWNGGPGNDTFFVNDQLWGGIIEGGDGADTLLLLGGGARIHSRLSSVERIVFPDAPHSDLLIPYSSAILDGAVTIFGGAGSDTVWVFDVAGPIVAVNFTLTSWGADDRLIFFGSGTITGGPDNDILAAESGQTTLIGGGGDDTLFSIPSYTPSTIIFDGGAGVDLAVMDFRFENGPLSYAVGDSAVREDGVNFVVTTSIERVVITGGASADTLTGGAGDDTLAGGPGGDTLNGAAGFDIVSYATTQSALTINVASGPTTWGPDAVGDVLSNFEGVRGGQFGDVMLTDGTMALFGWEGNDRLYGSNVADQLAGESGNDLVIGLGGDDTATLGDGIDYFYGGDGIDTGSGESGVDVLLGEAGNDILNGGADQDYLFGGDGNDTLNGDWGVDVLLGGAGNDVMNGGTEGDYFYGENGNDTGNGGDGNDIFVMTAGNDTANGDDGQDYFYMGDGDDVMNGGAGVDVMLGEAGNDTLNGGLGVDYLFLGPTGAGDNDTVIVDKVNTGVQVVFNFEAGGTNDVIRLVGSGLTTFQQVTANISDFTASGGFCILTLDADTAVWLIGVAPSQLTAGDFAFA